MTRELQLFKFAGRNAGPKLLVTGGVHGDEFEPIAALRRLTNLFAAEDSLLSILRGELTIVPCVNEEAFFLGRRCASDGLDLARHCPGKPHGTGTEEIAWSLSQLIKESDYYIDLHTGGTEFSLFPLAGYMLHPNSDVLNWQRQMARAFNLNVVWGSSPDLEGRSLSVARDADVPAIYCEYLGGGRCSSEGVVAYVEGCLNVMTLLQMIEYPLPDNHVQYVIEDPRPASGHLQVCHPAPVSGYFEPSVQLGQRVEAGSLLGTIFPFEELHPQPIESELTGIVLMLRTFPRVLAGDSVGVVLEV